MNYKILSDYKQYAKVEQETIDFYKDKIPEII